MPKPMLENHFLDLISRGFDHFFGFAELMIQLVFTSWLIQQKWWLLIACLGIGIFGRRDPKKNTIIGFLVAYVPVKWVLGTPN